MIESFFILKEKKKSAFYLKLTTASGNKKKKKFSDVLNRFESFSVVAFSPVRSLQCKSHLPPFIKFLKKKFLRYNSTSLGMQNRTVSQDRFK